jgi:hypothetical protein
LDIMDSRGFLGDKLRTVDMQQSKLTFVINTEQKIQWTTATVEVRGEKNMLVNATINRWHKNSTKNKSTSTIIQPLINAWLLQHLNRGHIQWNIK